MQLLKEKYLTNKDINFLPIKKKNMITFIKSKEPNFILSFFKRRRKNIRFFFNCYLYPETCKKKYLENRNSIKLKESLEKIIKGILKSLYIAYKDITKGEYENCDNSLKSNK